MYYRQTTRVVSRQYITNTAQDNSLHRIFRIVSSHTELFTDRRFCTQRLLHTDAFTQRRFYTQTFLHTDALHTDAFTHRRVYTQTLLHTNTFTQRLLHTDAFTHKHFYAQRPDP